MADASKIQFSRNIPSVVRRCFEQVATEPGLEFDIEQHAWNAFGNLTYWPLDATFVVEHAPAGRLLVVGAGAGSADVIAAIEFHCPDKQIVAIVDRRAATIREKSGYQVLTAAEASALDFDYALVCNANLEESMVRDLRLAGIPKGKIVAIRSQVAFREYQKKMMEERAAPLLVTKIRNRVPRVENVVLQPSRDIWTVVDDCALAEVLPPDKTVRLFTGHQAQMDVSDSYLTFDIRKSLTLLCGVLQALQPKCVYIRGSAHFEAQHLAVALRLAFPALFLAVEVYDYMCMFEDEILRGWEFSERSIKINRCAEAFMGRHADFIVDKTPGSGWKALVDDMFEVPRQHYFPRVRSSAPGATPDKAPRHTPATSYRLLCAGTFPEFYRFRPGHGFANSVFQDIVTPIDVLSGAEDIRIDVFNSGHEAGSATCEEHYSGYRAYFHPERVRYHPCLPFQRLVERMTDYDYGILLFAPTDMVIDFPLQESLPNRFMGYVQGELPVIVNKELSYCASLIETFNAGITVRSDQLADLPRQIRETDGEALRAGMRRLKSFMADHNRNALTSLREAIARKG